MAERIVAIIPARLESTRLPRKLLMAETGKTLIRETVNNLYDCLYHPALFCSVIVATDSEEIARSFGSDEQTFIVRTGQHGNGTSRVNEVMQKWADSAIRDTMPILRGRELPGLVVNIQADEPQISPESLEILIAAATEIPGCDMATLATSLGPGDQENPNIVKVFVGDGGTAEWFTRGPSIANYRHIGVYAYTPHFLKWFAAQPPTENEKRESLEQLRALDAGCRIRVAVVDHPFYGIDTRADYDRFVASMTLGGQ